MSVTEKLASDNLSVSRASKQRIFGADVNSEPEPPGSSDLRGRALDLLEHNLRRVETTPRLPLDPNQVRTEADQAVAKVLGPLALGPHPEGV